MTKVKTVTNGLIGNKEICFVWFNNWARLVTVPFLFTYIVLPIYPTPVHCPKPYISFMNIVRFHVTFTGHCTFNIV